MSASPDNRPTFGTYWRKNKEDSPSKSLTFVQSDLSQSNSKGMWDSGSSPLSVFLPTSRGPALYICFHRDHVLVPSCVGWSWNRPLRTRCRCILVRPCLDTAMKICQRAYRPVCRSMWATEHVWNLAGCYLEVDTWLWHHLASIFTRPKRGKRRCARAACIIPFACSPPFSPITSHKSTTLSALTFSSPRQASIHPHAPHSLRRKANLPTYLPAKP